MATTWIYSDRHIFPYTTLLRSVEPWDDVDRSSVPDGVTTTGLDNIDLWIGGLAEKILPFGGMLGSTFNFVFEVQMEQLQNADRFYYLQRLDGLHMFGELEGNSLASMIIRHTDHTPLHTAIFSHPGLIMQEDLGRVFTH